MNVGTQHRASYAARVGKQVRVRPAQSEGPVTDALLDLLDFGLLSAAL